ncbi:MAG TPA: hypothetical protein VFQ61_12285 [Polyangiaceae bacterium]|nr:hypothetical protein [Polyangiaceae bacterium]
MTLRIIVNLGSGSDPRTLLVPRFFGPDLEGDDYVIFNMDSGHMLVSTVLQKRTLESLCGFVRLFVPIDKQDAIPKLLEKPTPSAHLVNLLFTHQPNLVPIIEAMTLLERLALQFIEERLRSTPSRSATYKIQGTVIHVPDPKAGARELALPNFERSKADDVQLPLGSVYANVAISPFGFHPITQATVELLRPKGYFVVIGNQPNKFFKFPAGDRKPGEFGLEPCALPRCLDALNAAPSVHTNGGQVDKLLVSCFQLQ